MANQKVSQTIKTTVIGTESNTYEIIKEYTEDKSSSGEEAVIIQLYPTVGIDDVSKTDSTTLHLQNKMKQLGWKKVHILNLFSKIAKWKPLAGELKSVDRENMTYIKKVISDVAKRGKIIICWGNSHNSNLAVNETKKELLEFLISSEIESFQLVTENMMNETEGTHILFLGLRYANDKWSVIGYPAEEQLEKISAQVQKRRPKEKAKKSPKKEGGKENNVSEDNE